MLGNHGSSYNRERITVEKAEGAALAENEAAEVRGETISSDASHA